MDESYPGSGGPRGEKAAFQWQSVAHRWDRHSDHVRGIPIKERACTQIGRGWAVWESIWGIGRDVCISRSRVVPKLAIDIVPCTEWVAFLAPVSLQGKYIFNGYEARPFDIFLSVGGDGFASTGEKRDILVIAIRRARLLSECCALAGRTADDVHLRDLTLNVGQRFFFQFYDRLIKTLLASRGALLFPGHYALPDVVERDIVTFFAQLLLPHVTEEASGYPSHFDALSVVRQAQTAFADPARTPNIADLCSASGVSARWLHKCFVDIYGTSPSQYIRLRRLSVARERLLDPNAPAKSVKEVALSLGFLESGRFAEYYRSIFGERPKETLFRSTR
jgi:AraC-like DNA-binding protein